MTSDDVFKILAMLTVSLALAAALVVLNGCDGNKVSPEVAADKFAQALNMPIAGITCTHIDSDGDGYVTCTLSIAGDKPRMESIQCAALGAWQASGCKLTEPKLQRNN